MYTCTNCGNIDETRTTTDTIEETYPVKGEPTSIMATVRLCAGCSEAVYDRELDTENLSRAFDKYRTKHGILSPAEIKATRERYGFTQRSLSNLLGMGEISVHRYESGSIPDDVHNGLLMLIQHPSNMMDILKERGSQIPRAQLTKALARVEQIMREESPGKLLELVTTTIAQKGPSLYTGFLAFQPEKLIDMILFFATKADGLYKTKLNKLLWYADFTHYRYFGLSISGACYIHRPFGPCADQYSYFLSYLLEEKMLQAKEVFFDTASAEMLSATTDLAIDLTSTNIEVMTAIHDYFAKMSSKDISKCSHEEEGYTNTTEGQPISYSYADTLKIDIGGTIPSLGK